MIDTAKRKPVAASVAWAPIADSFHRYLTPAHKNDLCEQLRLPRLALDALPLIGYDAGADCWTYPEEDGGGRVIGIVRRYRDGAQKPMVGSSLGLIVPHGWRERDTSLFIVESLADVLALSLCAVSAIGLPSIKGGAKMLVALLAGFPLDRAIVVIGAVADRLAEVLAATLQRRIAWTLPPDGAKDLHTWILSQNPDPHILDDWHIIGEHLWEN